MNDLELKPEYVKHGYGKQTSSPYDDIYTPPSALLPLLPYLKREWVIWEPACGQNHLVTALIENGFRVVFSDIKMLDRFDFLTTPPFTCDMILTNPPYSLKDDFLAHCYKLGKPFALLLPLTALEGQKRQALYRRHGLQLLLMDRRVNFITPSGKGSGSWFPVGWFCWKLNLPSDLMFAQTPKQAIEKGLFEMENVDE